MKEKSELQEHLIKFAVIGREKSGKSNLISKYVSNSYPHLDDGYANLGAVKDWGYDKRP